MGTAITNRTLLIYVVVMTYVTCANSRSLNKINYGISFQKLGFGHMVMGDYRYEYIITLPNTTHQHYPEMIPACNNEPTNTSVSHARNRHAHPKDEPHTVDCTSNFRAVLRTLHKTDRKVHKEVNRLITDIRNELPKRINLRQNRKTRAWFNIVGKLFKNLFGTMDDVDSTTINARLKTLERYTDESSRRTKQLHVSRLITEERILQNKMTENQNELLHNTMVLTIVIEHRSDNLKQELDWTNVLLSKALQLLYNGKIITANLEKLLKAIQELN